MPWWPWSVFVAAAVASAGVILYQGRGLLFFFDEWAWILERRNPSLDSLLRAHAGHLSLLPVAIYQLWFRIWGITDYTPYRVMPVVLHLVCVTLAFVYLRRRSTPVLALVAAVVLLFFGSAWQDLLWPFQIGFLLSIAAGLGAFLLLDADEPRADVGVMSCIAVALASSSIGVPITAAIGLELVLRRAWRRTWIVAVPASLYLVWYAVYSDTLTSVDGPVAFVRFVVEAAGAVVGGLAGVGDTAGQWLLLAVVPVVVVGCIRAPSERRQRLLALSAIPIVFWSSIAVTRAGFHAPNSSRYLYPAAVFVILVLCECVRDVRLPAVALVALALLGVWSVAWNVQRFEDGRQLLVPLARAARIQLGALEIGTHGVDPAYVAVRPPLPKDVGRFAAALDALGSPGDSPAQIRRAPENDRRAADAFLVHALALRLGAPTTVGGRPPVVRRVASGPVDGSCVTLTASRGDVDVELTPGTRALRIDALGAPVEVWLRNFADGYFTLAQPWKTVGAGDSRDVPLPRVTAGPWRVGLRTPSTVRVCGTAGPGT